MNTLYVCMCFCVFICMCVPIYFIFEATESDTEQIQIYSHGGALLIVYA